MKNNIIRAAREAADMSMHDTAVRLQRLSGEDRRVIAMSIERIGRIEREESKPTPDEIYSLSRAYDDPALCYDYCTEVCGLGCNIMPKFQKCDSLTDITVALLGSVREFEETEKRLTMIAGDGRIDCLEKKDFERIIDLLDRMAGNVQSMKFWAQTHVKE